MGRRAALILLVAALAAMPAAAQGGDGPPPCDADQRAQVAAALERYTGALAAWEAPLQGLAAGEAVPADERPPLPEVAALQFAWWNEVAPGLPRCAQAVEATLTMGRALDEAFFGLALWGAGYPEAAARHAAQVALLRARLEALAGLVEPVTATPSGAPGATPRAETWYVNATSRVNVRECPSTDCRVITALNPGQAIQVIATAEDWHRIGLPEGETGYIAVWLTSRTRPLPTPQPPAQQNPPAPPPPSASGAVCPSLRATCSQMTCEQAYACLAAGNRRLDQDGDGVPCESICPGG